MAAKLTCPACARVLKIENDHGKQAQGEYRVQDEEGNRTILCLSCGHVGTVEAFDAAPDETLRERCERMLREHPGVPGQTKTEISLPPAVVLALLDRVLELRKITAEAIDDHDSMLVEVRGMRQFQRDTWKNLSDTLAIIELSNAPAEAWGTIQASLKMFWERLPILQEALKGEQELKHAAVTLGLQAAEDAERTEVRCTTLRRERDEAREALRQTQERLTIALDWMGEEHPPRACLLCGKDKPCMTEADIDPAIPAGVPCTFDYTYHQLITHCHQLEDRLRQAQEADEKRKASTSELAERYSRLLHERHMAQEALAPLRDKVTEIESRCAPLRASDEMLIQMTLGELRRVAGMEKPDV